MKGKRVGREDETTFRNGSFSDSYLNDLEVGDKVLDVGGAKGELSEKLGAEEIVVLDNDIERIRIGHGKFDVEHVFGDATDMPFQRNCFDSVVSFHFLEHLFVDELFKTIKEIWRVLKPSGNLVFVLPYYRNFNARAHRTFFDERALRYVFQFDFEVDEINRINKIMGGDSESELEIKAHKRELIGDY